MTFEKAGAAKDIGFAGLFAPINSVLGLLASAPTNVETCGIEMESYLPQAGFQKAKFVFS
jgi:hypothetical protein